MNTFASRYAFLFVISLLPSGLVAQWTQTKGPEGGNVTRLLVSTDTLFAGTGAGVFRSTDGGVSWQPRNSTIQDAIHVGVAAFHQTRGALFVSTGGGIFRSTNNADTWTQVSYMSNAKGIVSVEDTVVALGFPEGVYRSTDLGFNWQASNAGLTNNGTKSLVLLDNKVLLGTDIGQIFLSTDYGTTWSLQGQPPYSYFLNELFSLGNVLLAGTANLCWRSTDDGQTWTQAPGPYDEQAFANVAGTLFVGCTGTYTGQPLWSSADTGKTWSPMATWPAGVAIYALAYQAPSLYAGTPKGVYVSTDGGATWTFLRKGLSANTPNRIILDSTSIMTNSIGIGVQKSVDAGNNWTSIIDTIPNINDLKRIGSNVYIGANGVYVTTDNGATWNSMNTGIPSNAIIQVLGGEPSRLLAGSNGQMFKSTNGGANWVSISTGLPASTWIFSIWSDSTCVLAGTGGSGIYRSTDDGVTWNASNTGILAGTWIYAIQSGDDCILAGGYNSSYQNGVYISTDKGLTWELRIGGLEGSPSITDIFVRGTNYFVARSNGRGVHYSGNGGKSWIPVRDGLPASANTSTLSINGNNTTLFAGHIGLWKRPLTEFPLTTKITLSSSSLQFGSVKVGEVKRLPLTITNVGIDTLKVQGFSISNVTFTSTAISFQLAPGTARTDTVSSTPTTYGPINAVLVVQTNSSTGPDTITLSATGLAPVLSSSVSFLSFGNVEFTHSKDTVLTFGNSGNDTLKVTSIATTNTDFTTRPSNFSILPGQSFNDTIRYTPTKEYLQDAHIVLQSNSLGSPDSVRIQGYGFGYGVLGSSADTVDFGSVQTATTKDTVLTLTNSGSDTLIIADINFTDPSFSTPETSFVLLRSNSKQHAFRFHPPTGPLGQYAGRAMFTPSKSATIHDIVLRGFALEARPFFFSRQLAFGTVAIGRQKTLPLVLQGLGNDTVRFSEIRSLSSAFTVSPLLQKTKQAPDVDTAWVTYSPSVVRNDSSKIIFFSNSLSGSDTIFVSGIGATAAINLSSKTLSFGSVKLGQFKDTTITISNTGVDTLKITNIASEDTIFSARPKILTLSPGANTKDTLRFKPAAIASFSGKLIITSNATNSPDTIVVSGIGISATGVYDLLSKIPREYSLSQNYPNPFNPSTVIRYGLPTRSDVKLEIYNILGQRVAVLMDEEQDAGFRETTWEASVASGLYFYRLEAVASEDANRRFVQVKKMLLLR